MLESHPVYWDKRIVHEFGTCSSPDKTEEDAMDKYFHKCVVDSVIYCRYNDWYEQQQSFLQGTLWEETTINILVRLKDVDLQLESKCCLGSLHLSL